VLGYHNNGVSPNLVMAPALGAGIISVQIRILRLDSFKTVLLDQNKFNHYNNWVNIQNNVSRFKVQKRSEYPECRR